MARHSQIGVFNRLAIPPGRRQILRKEKKRNLPDLFFFTKWFPGMKTRRRKMSIYTHLSFQKQKKSTGIRNFSRKKLTGQEDEANHFITAQKSQPCNLVIHYSLQAWGSYSGVVFY